MRRFVVLLTALYLLALVAIAVLSRHAGEYDPATAFLIFLPQVGWLFPLLLLVPLALWRARVCVLPLLVGSALFAWLHLGFHWSAARAVPTENVLTVLTNNRGEDHEQSFSDYLEAQKPDIMVFQDDTHQAALRATYPDYTVQSHGRFTLVTRLLLNDSGYVKLKTPTPVPVAAWYEVEYQGTPLVIYNVHLPTPRRDLTALGFGGLQAALFGWSSETLKKQRQQEQEHWLARTRMAEELAAILVAEKRPCIVAGDFNMPAWGRLHTLFQAHLEDAYASAGRGWGYSFPGDARNPFSFLGPWLRLDYIFTNSSFKPLQAETEPQRLSQHRCVVARLQKR